MKSNKYLIVIVGPTAIGKTSLSIRLAKQFLCEIISADSRQFYKEMNIGTAKPSRIEMDNLKHHFIDSLSVDERYSAGQFEKDALTKLDELYKTNNICILVGGSGLYIDSVCNGFHALPKDEELKNYLENELEAKGLEYMQALLKEKSPHSYQLIDIKNKRRIVRAIELAIITENNAKSIKSNPKASRNFSIIKIGLNTDRQKLYERINARVDIMIQNGLFQEATSLYPFRNLTSLQTVGYREIFDFLDGKCDIKRAIELIKQNTRHFAKRQLTWFKKDEKINWFDLNQESEIFKYLDICMNEKS
jgi:tRNA dimethylallyltransferase